MKRLVIIPSYNEKENLEKLIPVVLGIDSRLSVLVVDDNSPDKTVDLVQEQMAGFKERLFLLSRPAKMGLASAYIQGFKWGLGEGFDFLIQMDADWSHSPKYLATMLSLAHRADLLIGSRYVDSGGVANWSSFRLLISRWGNLYAREVLGLSIRDLTGGFNGWHGQVLKSIAFETVCSNGYSFQIELKHRAARLGVKILEFPIIFEERRAGQSKMSGTIIFEAAWKPWQIKYVGKFSPPAFKNNTKL
jgi:dolichol-phosphate mannosyltransferase